MYSLAWVALPFSCPGLNRISCWLRAKVFGLTSMLTYDMPHIIWAYCYSDWRCEYKLYCATHLKPRLGIFLSDHLFEWRLQILKFRITSTVFRHELLDELIDQSFVPTHEQQDLVSSFHFRDVQYKVCFWWVHFGIFLIPFECNLAQSISTIKISVIFPWHKNIRTWTMWHGANI